MSDLILIDAELWKKTRAGARAGRGFRYQDAAGALLAVEAWIGDEVWNAVVPEGVDDITLHGHECEIRAQLKARHDPQGTFSLTEAASFLAKAARALPANWAQGGRVHLALVLERPVAGLAPTGWRINLQESGQPLDTFREALLRVMEVSPETIGEILEHTHVVVEQEPLERAIPKLEAQAGLVTATARLVLQQLREAAGHAADQNFSASADRPVSLGATDVQERIDAIGGIVDPVGYLALTEGLCDVANFSQPLTPADFYSGVNVMPGHVGAGLVFERPAHTTEILEALESKRIALVVGPSGVGKSALAWLAAYHTRHAVRWYRIRRVGPDDIGRLVQLARTLDVRPERPVGFMVDDVGREETSGWDALVREAEALAGLLLMGSVREEDVFTLSTAARSPLIRPTLDEEFAERIWLALSTGGATQFGHWREPFELSRGLLLEYTHLLTEGCRLEETIREQVRRRLDEKRDDELLILQSVAFAAAHGGAIDQTRFRNRLGWEPPRFARALNRLINEHAIRQRSDGTLAGLHEIRSSHLDAAIRELLGDSVKTAMTGAVQGLYAADFATFLLRTLRRWPDQQAELIEALSQRVGEGDLTCWAPILHGLGLATADLVATRWLEISRKAGIDDRFAPWVLNLVMAHAELDDIPGFTKAKHAQEEFASVKVEDFRCQLTDYFRKPAKMLPLDLEAYHELIATLLPLEGCPTGPELTFSVDQNLFPLPLIPLLETIRTAHEVGLQFAQRLVDAAGGTDVLLERLYCELPWVTRPVFDETSDMPSISADVRVISDEHQPDVHGDVVRFCELMLAAAPAATLVKSNAVFADGSPARIGDFTIATKCIPRKNLPPPARVAWNRAQLRAVQRLVSASCETKRITAFANAIEELAKMLREAGEFYCRMETPKKKWRFQMQLREVLTDFMPPPPINDVVPNALSQGSYAVDDGLYGFATGIQRLLGELTDGVSKQPALMATRTADLARIAEALLDPSIWRLTAEAPLKALHQIREGLWDIRAVLGDTANDSRRRQIIARRFSRSSRRHMVLPRAAQDARIRAEADVTKHIKALESVCEQAGMNVQVFSRLNEKDHGFMWPDVGYAGLLVTNSIVEWHAGLEHFQKILQAFPNSPRFSYAPLINGQIPPIAVVFMQRWLPHANFLNEWSAHLPYSFIEDSALTHFTSGMEALRALSVIFGERGRPLIEEEEAYVSKLVERFNGNLQWFVSELETTPEHEHLAEAHDFLCHCSERVRAEFEAPYEGESLAVEVLRSTEGVASDLFRELIQHRITLMEQAMNRG